MKRYQKISLGLMALLGSQLAVAETGNSIVYLSVNGDHIEAISAAYGASSTQDVDSVNDPMLHLNLGGENVDMYTYGCVDNSNCDGLQLRAEFKAGVDSGDMNTWNANKSWSRAYLDDDGLAIIESDLILTGGVTQKNIHAWMDKFETSVAEFVSHIQ